MVTDCRATRGRRLLPLLAVLLLIAAPVFAGDFSAALDRPRMRANETLTLRLSATGDASGEPDLGPLRADFEVLNQSSGSRMSIVNGVVSQGRDWTLELAPKRSGRLTIPALSLGSAQSRALTVEVVPADQADPGTGPRSVFVDTAVDADRPYLQQPFGYRLRVFYREKWLRAVLSDPEVKGATLERQGEDQTFVQEVDGQRYTVIERRFLVVPRQSGPLTIQGPRLEALMPGSRPGGRRGPFGDLEDLFGGQPFQGLVDLADPDAGRRVIERGPDRTVEVRPRPAGQDGTWLPAESVQLSDEWTPSPPRFRVGEPVTRTLVITAQGTSAALLPTLNPGTPENARVYPEPPRQEDLPGPRPTALKTLKLALIPTRPGALTLPEIRLDWWDTTTDRPRVAVIPERTVQVAPAPAGTGTPPPAAAPAPPVKDSATTPPDTGTTAPGAPPGPLAGAAPADAGPGISGAATQPWPWVALVLGLGWLGTLAWVLWPRRRPAPGGDLPPGTRGQPAGSPASRRHQVRQACLAGDPGAAREALLAWGEARWPTRPPRGLGDLGTRLGGAASEVLESLDRTLYTLAGGPWDGTGTWERLAPHLEAAERAINAKGPRPNQAGALPGLYPDLGGS